ncbi:DMT family transporter [Pontibacillus salicampi]|uniref:DMT family transporter n=1 Tax=Pontibacillus salicampi TaxID=1449801 RepID=A0ABV6LK71_9BACI
MIGALFSIIAGVCISTQNVFNSRISEKGGSWATTTIVLGVGFVSSLPVFYLLDDTQLFVFSGVNPVYLFSGVFGVGIVFCLMRGISLLGPAYAVSIVLISQLTIATVVNTYGLFGFPSQAFTVNKAVGLCILIVGVLIFKLGGNMSRLLKQVSRDYHI